MGRNADVTTKRARGRRRIRWPHLARFAGSRTLTFSKWNHGHLAIDVLAVELQEVVGQLATMNPDASRSEEEVKQRTKAARLLESNHS